MPASSIYSANAHSSFGKLLGSELLTKTGKKSTADALAGKQFVCLYFSAHWCPPCRRFTPQLADKYSASEGVSEIIFVSSDQDAGAFQGYYKDMPWLAMPYADRDRKAALTKQFGISGIPSLVVLDAATGKLVTDQGRAQVDKFFAKASSAAARPASKPSSSLPKAGSGVFDELLGGVLLTKQGEKPTAGAFEGKKYVCLYFSAHWCPPCRRFTPQLADKYSASAGESEVVFVSSDQDASGFEAYYKGMPWLALPFVDRERKAALSRRYNVNGIPTLVVLDAATGKHITSQGRSQVDKFFPSEKSVCGGCTIA